MSFFHHGPRLGILYLPPEIGLGCTWESVYLAAAHSDFTSLFGIATLGLHCHTGTVSPLPLSAVESSDGDGTSLEDLQVVMFWTHHLIAVSFSQIPWQHACASLVNITQCPVSCACYSIIRLSSLQALYCVHPAPSQPRAYPHGLSPLKKYIKFIRF